MKTLARNCRFYLIAIMVLIVMRSCVLAQVQPGTVGVRYNNATGLLKEDLAPGWHLEIVGLQKIWSLPSRYLFLNYADNQVLSIRTKDNNTVRVDVSVPYRIIPGMAHAVMDAGNHLETGRGRYRFERFANDTTISVLREQLANLQSQDFYDTERRLQVAGEALKTLNGKLQPLHLEASAILIRASYFRENYEKQLAQIQLNEQQKLLDGAKKLVANERQKLDNYIQQTNALVAAKAQDWNRRIAELDRAYQVGFLETGTDQTPGATRRILTAMDDTAKQTLIAKAADVFSIPEENVTDGHLLGIKNIQAETTEYGQRVRSQADGIAARLAAEGEAQVATVQGRFESKLNTLLSTPGGRAYVAYQAADNVKFDSTLKFQSREGIPAILRLRDFAQKFMGR